MANTYLNRTQTAGTSTRKFTFSAWVKRAGQLGASYSVPLFGSYYDDSNRGALYCYQDQLLTYFKSGGSDQFLLKTKRKFRDTNGWYHFVMAVDTTQSTANNRVKLYVNGEQIAVGDLETNNQPSQNADFATVGVNSRAFEVGRMRYGSTPNNVLFDGYMSHASFVDGQALAPTVFGSTDSTSGIWKFKSPSGVTWGNNGFHLKFESSGNLGLDSSGNSNTFTVNGNGRQSLDTPSNLYTTLNAVANTNSNSTISHGALTHTVSGQWLGVISSFGVTSGKWYAEAKITDEQNFSIGFATLVGSFVKDMNTANLGYLGRGDDSWGFWGNGSGSAQKTHNGSSSNYGSALSTNDIMILAMDVDNKKLYFGKNGTFFDSSNPTTQASPAFTFTTTEPMGFASGPENGAVQWNFGAGTFGDTPISSAGSNGNGYLFEYDVPSGYYALNTKNLNTYG